jgi:ribosomal protein L29
MNFPEQVDKHRPVGENPPNGLIVSYYLKDEVKDEITLDILDSSGRPVRHYSSKPSNKFEQPPEWPDLEKPPDLLPTSAGMNRFPWNLRYDSPTDLPGAFYAGNGPEGPIVLPGTYTLKLTVGGNSQTVPAEIKLDPRVHVSAADLQNQLDLELKVRSDIEALHVAVNQIRGVRSQLAFVKTHFDEEGDKGKSVVAAIDDLNKKMDPVEQELLQVKRKSSEGNLRYPNMLNEEYDSFRATIENADAAPTESELGVFKGLHERLEKQLAAWKQIASTDVPAVNELVRKGRISLIEVPSGRD